MIEVHPDGPLEEPAVAAFEDEFSLKLPTRYRAWLLEVGGGEAAADYKVENGVVSEFLGIGGDVGYDLATWRRDRSGFSAWIPEQFVVIAPGSGGALCLQPSGPEADSIWWADFDEAVERLGEPGQNPNSAAPQPYIMRRVADDLPSFLHAYLR